MKKLTAVLTAVLMVILSVSANAETAATDLWAQLSGQMFLFCSGAGAWDTDLTIEEDGTFTGSYHDSEMGETGEGYPNGTVYGCLFHGQLSDPEPVDEYTWTAKITVEQDEGQVPESIEDGIRFVTAAPYGLENAQAVAIFLPGKPVDSLPEGFMAWSHLGELEPDAEVIPYYAIWNEADEAGFIAFVVSETVEGPLSGGWTPAADPTVTEERKALFEKGISGLLGVNYTPVAYLGSQVVAGTNHAFLCQMAAVYPGAQPAYVIVYLYEDLQGNVSVLEIADFDIESLCTYGAGTEDTAETVDPSSMITAQIVDGCYVLTVQTDGRGEWRADDMAQDPSVVKLASSGLENGVFTACYAPAGDGETTVALRRMNVHDTCDELYTFTLLVKDGQVQESTGGSYQAAPDESEIYPFFSGEWLEKDTQFTTLTVTKPISDGWDVEILSPVSRGSWVLRATVYYDCDNEAFVYSDGVKYDLIPGETLTEREAASGLCGTLSFSEADGRLLLTWYDAENAEGETVTFERAPALPAYMYTGDDPIEGAIANYLAADECTENYLKEQGCVTIPCPIIHDVEMTDETHAKVYGTFWILNYAKRGQTLSNISGGEYPAVILLEKVNDLWQVVSMEEAGDGTDYGEDIERFANGNKELENKYYAAADLGAPENQAVRTRFIKAYVDAYGLNITEYQDYGWEPIPLQ